MYPNSARSGGSQPEGAGPASGLPGRRCGPAYKVGLTDADGNAWIPATLAAYLEEHQHPARGPANLSHLITVE